LSLLRLISPRSDLWQSLSPTCPTCGKSLQGRTCGKSPQGRTCGKSLQGRTLFKQPNYLTR
ncbi:MAG TPA: hypothetical protein PL034_02390, partial [Candidatus Paceibacterota bacterium]|nr:hypothetical protein [Candidatus Paceibacterota bacterium]